MNIALAIIHADPARGGAERYTVDLAAALVDRGHDVSLLACTFGRHIPARPVALHAHAPTRIGSYIKYLDALDDHLHKHSYDIVHAMLPVRRCDIYHPHAGLAIEAVKTGHQKHANPLRRSLAKVANRLNLKRTHFARIERRLLTGPRPPVVLCLSDYLKQSIRSHYSMPESRLATLFNAVDLGKFDPDLRPEAGTDLRRRFQIPPRSTVALMIAQDYPRKGLREAILAMSRLDDPHLRLLVVGKQKTAPWKRLARQHGVADRVLFAGPTTDPYSFYRASDFFVLPTRHDPCSLVVLESLAMGLPVISTVFNGACEIMTGADHGHVLPDPADIDALVSAMKSLTDPATRQRCHDNCLALRPSLSFDAHVDQLLKIYESRPRSGKLEIAK